MTLEVLPIIKADWIKPLWKQLGRISGERAKELVRLRDEFVDPNVLKDVYIVPDLQDRNPADAHQDELLDPARQSAFERINQFFQGDLPLEKDGRHQMFILSDAGMGKTSLLLMLKLMHLTSFWPKRYNCELLKLGDNTLERVRNIPNKGETFLLLDALDEDRQAWKRVKERLFELLQESDDFRRVIISSRTQFFPEVEPDSWGRPEIKVLSGFQCPVLYLSPFSDHQVHEFIEKKMPLALKHRLLFQSGKIKRRRQKATLLITQMQDLRMRPMLLQHIDKLMDADCATLYGGWNSYTIYQALINEWLDREVRKLKKQHGVNAVIPKRKELIHSCVKVAEWMQHHQTRVISEDDMLKLITDDHNVYWIDKFDFGGRSLMNRNSDRAFRFCHYTIQEFLIIYGIINELLNKKNKIKVTDQMIFFMNQADLTNSQADNQILDLLLAHTEPSESSDIYQKLIDYHTADTIEFGAETLERSRQLTHLSLSKLNSFLLWGKEMDEAQERIKKSKQEEKIKS